MPMERMSMRHVRDCARLKNAGIDARDRASRWGGVEERSVKTPGRGRELCGLDTAVRWLLKPRLLSQDMVGPVKLSAEGHFRPDLTDGRLTIISG
jgi:hypothetical protein